MADPVLCAECLASHCDDEDNSLCAWFTPCPPGVTVEEARDAARPALRQWRETWERRRDLLAGVEAQRARLAGCRDALYRLAAGGPAAAEGVTDQLADAAAAINVAVTFLYQATR